MMPEGPAQNSIRPLTLAWAVLTSVLAASCLTLSLWSGAFARDIEPTERPAVLLAVALVASGFIFLLTIPLIKRSLGLDRAQQKTIISIMIAGGLAMRLAFMGSTPMLEDDWYRYLWDGGVTAHGYNPYTASPDDAQGEPYHYTLQPLAHQSGVVIERVNHSDLTTVYPPVAQTAFAFAHLISPWSLQAWRGICLASEITTLLLLLSLADQIGRSRLWAALYWLSPLAAKEFINSAHMDVIVLPLVLGAALLSLKQRHLSAVTLLGLAVGAKFWPALLAPLVLRPLTGNPKRLIIASLIFAVLCIAAATPQFFAALDTPSGIAAYASNWRNNSAHYGLLEAALAWTLKPLALDARMPGTITRILLAGCAGLFALWSARKPIENGSDLMRRLGLVTAAIVLLSPSQFPWYGLWVLPFLVFTPWSGLLLMAALIPIYYASFYYSARDSYAIYRDTVVYSIWLPVWALLAYEAWRVIKKGEPPLIDGSSGSGHA